MDLEYGDLLKETVIKESGCKTDNRVKDYLDIKQVLIEGNLKTS